MVSQDGLSLLSFNGEIYNFVELKDELRGRGISFRGHSDTEVLLQSYLHWGTGVFNRLNGMWAFVLWDGRQRKLVVSRDRFGAKPLYYAHLGATWIFASEYSASRCGFR
jgi:asparagine synthase (glutamine-hydrolysing)